MKIIKSLHDFDGLNEAEKPDTLKYQIDITKNLAKATKIQKSLLDAYQALFEIADDTSNLTVMYGNLIDTTGRAIIENIKANTESLRIALKDVDADGKKIGLIEESAKLQRNIDRLKKEYLKKRKNG